MYLEKNEIRLKRPGHPNPSGSLPYNFPQLIETLKHQKSWKKGELTSMILMKNPTRKIVLALMQPGTEVSSFQANDSITFRVLEGKINLRTGKGSLVITRGEIVILHDKVKYVIDTVDESALLITLESRI